MATTSTSSSSPSPSPPPPDAAATEATAAALTAAAAGGTAAAINTATTSANHTNTSTTTTATAQRHPHQTMTTATATTSSKHHRKGTIGRDNYLCAAPKPDSWEAHTATIIAQIPGDSAVAKYAHLKPTVDKIRTQNPEVVIGREGPGRRSNTEHAVNLYVVVLEKLAVMKKLEEEEQQQAEEEEEARLAKGKKKTKTGSGGGRRKSGGDDAEDEDDDDGDDDDDDDTTASSEPLLPPRDSSQYRGICAVCEEKGRLALVDCTTCHRTFHGPCVRPPLCSTSGAADVVAAADDDWQCPYCLLQIAPKHTPVRRVNAAGVRLMARMRNAHRRNKAAGEFVSIQEDDKKDSKDNETKASPASGASDDEIEVSPTTRRSRRGAASKGGDAAPPATPPPSRTSSTTADSGGSGRAQRNRRRPSNYDPQSGPARQWQSDQKHRSASEKGSDVSDDDSDDSDGEETTKRATKSHTTPPRRGNTTTAAASQPRPPHGRTPPRGGGVWCTFCHDDPTIQVCFFCACRVCFGKHNQTKLLLCDQCDDEYHTFCLDPPLSQVPRTAKWYCPSCVRVQERVKPRVGTRGAVKSTTEQSAAGGPTLQTRTSSRKPVPINRDSPDIVEPKKRGRSTIKVVAKEPPATARRGAAKASSKAAAARGKSDNKTAAKRGPGRPPKNGTAANVPTWPPSGNSRGRSTKKQKDTASKEKSRSLSPVTEKSAASRKRGRLNKASSSVLPPQKRRGRPPKNPPNAPSWPPGGGLPNSTGRLQYTDDPAAAYVAASVAAGVPVNMPYLAAGSAVQPDSVVAAEPPPVTVSRSGRTVRRHTFHDEVAEGDQHLRSGRYHMEMSGGQVEGATATASQTGQMNVDAAAAAAGQLTTLPGNAPGLAFAAASQLASIGGLGTASSNNMYTEQALMAGYPLTSAGFPPSMGSASASAAAARAPPAAAVATATAARREDDAKDAKAAPRRKPGSRECTQITRRFGVQPIEPRYMDILLDYCKRGKVEHLIRMRERLDEHSRMLEQQLAGLEMRVQEVGESDVVVPAMPRMPRNRSDTF